MLHASVRALIVAVGVMSLRPPLVGGQNRVVPGVPSTTASGSAWTSMLTAGGQPDLQGFWVINTVTPVERPAELTGKEFFTEQEALEWERTYFERRWRASKEAATSPEVTPTWNVPGKVVPTRRTSLVVDPPDGRIPLTAEGRRRASIPVSLDNSESLDPSDRCIVWAEGPPLLPSGVNANFQIVQGPGYVVILHEMIHHARIIPLDNRPPLPSSVQQWGGDSRGRWDGNTLTVETTNFTDRTRFRGSTAALRVVERFKRIADEMIWYSFTVEDPTAFERPWTAEMAIVRSEPIFEYACHEANYSLVNMLSGARTIEKENVAR